MNLNFIILIYPAVVPLPLPQKTTGSILSLVTALFCIFEVLIALSESFALLTWLLPIFALRTAPLVLLNAYVE